MNLQEKLSIINSIPRVNGIFGFSALTEKKSLKKSRITKEPTPKRLEKIFVEFTGTVWMGGDYQTMVNKIREKENIEPDFESKGTYCKPVSENLLLWEHNKTKQLYFRVYLGYGSTFTTSVKFYDAFGDKMTMEEYSEIKKHYLPLDYENKSQGTEQEILVKNYKVENVTKLKRFETWIDAEKESK